MVIGLICIFIVVILVDYPSLTKADKKTNSTYFLLLILGFTISVLQIIDKAPPSPAIIIEEIVRTIVKG